MFTRKNGADESAAGGQGQLHRDEKEHKPVLKKVKEKVRKIKHTLVGHSHSHGHGDEHGQRHERADDDVSSGDGEEEGDAALEREAAMEKGGYMEDVEDKPVALKPYPEVHGAPMYDSGRTPAVQDLFAKYDPARAPAAREAQGSHTPGMRFGDLGGAAVHDPATRQSQGSHAPGVRFGDLGGAAVHDPAAPQAQGSHAPGVPFGDLGGAAVHDPAAREAQDSDARGVRFGGAAVHDPAAREAQSFDTPGVRFGGAAVHDPAARAAQDFDAPGVRFGGAAVHDPAAREAQGFDAPGVRFGGAAVHDPAAREAQGFDAPGVRFGGAAVHDPAAREARRDDSPKVWLGDLGGPVVEDPAAPRSTTPAAREGEDIGTTPVIREFESMTLSDDPAHVGVGKKGARAEEWKDAATHKLGGASGGATYTDKLKNVAAVPAEYGKKLASTVYEKVAGGGGAAVDAGKRDDEHTEAMPVSDVGAEGEEWKEAPAAVDTTARSSGPGYTDKIKSTAASTTEYGKQLSSTAYDKVAGVGAAVAPSLSPQVGAGKQEEGRNEATPVSDVGADERIEAAATDATDSASGPGYTDKIKSAAAGTTEYGKQLASTVYEKVAGVGAAVAPSLRPQVGAGKEEDGRNEAMQVSDVGAEQRKEAAASDATDSAPGPGYTDKIKSAAAGTTEYGRQLVSTVYEKVSGVSAAVAPSLHPQVGAGKQEDRRNEAMQVSDVGTEHRKEAAATDATDSASGPGHTDKIKSSAAGTTEYGKQLASTVYEKVAGVGTAVVGKVQQATQSAGTATPGVGEQQETRVSTVTSDAGGPGNGQDKGVTMTGYIAEKLRPGNEDRALSSAISGAVQRRKEEVGGTVGQRMPAPSQVITKAREAVTSLTGGNRISETVQPNAATGADVKDNVAAEAPLLRRN